MHVHGAVRRAREILDQRRAELVCPERVPEPASTVDVVVHLIPRLVFEEVQAAHALLRRRLRSASRSCSCASFASGMLAAQLRTRERRQRKRFFAMPRAAAIVPVVGAPSVALADPTSSPSG